MNMEMRENVADAIYKGLKLEKPYLDVADNVLSLFNDSIKGIEWVGKCDHSSIDYMSPDTKAVFVKGCVHCNGTGTITRPATLEEVLGKVTQQIKLLDFLEVETRGMTKLLSTLSPLTKQALTVNNGTLRLKETP